MTLATIITIGTIIGFVFVVDSHFAKAEPTQVAIDNVIEDLLLLNDRVEAMKIEDELLMVKKKLYAIEDRWGEKYRDANGGKYHESIEQLLAFMPKEYREEYRQLDEKRKLLEKQLEEKIHKKKGG